MSNRLSRVGMDPYFRLILDGWVRYEVNDVTVIQAIYMPITPCEDGPVHRGPKVRGLSDWKWWGRLGHLDSV